MPVAFPGSEGKVDWVLRQRRTGIPSSPNGILLNKVFPPKADPPLAEVPVQIWVARQNKRTLMFHVKRKVFFIVPV